MMTERRKWTEPEKAAMIEEAEQPGSSISEVSRRYGVPTNLLFCWRRTLRGGKPELQKILSSLNELEKEVTPLLADLRLARSQGTMSPLNAANGFAAVANAMCKVQLTKFELINRMNAADPSQEVKDEQAEDCDPKMERAAERLLVSVVKKQLAHDSEAS